jgi:hypothetical protein
MNNDFLKLSFGKVISHVFPGFLFLIENVILFYLYKYGAIEQFFNTIFGLDWNSQAILFLLLIFIGTIFGTIIDAIQHFFFEEILSLFHKEKKGGAKREFCELFSLANSEEADIYKHWVDEEFQYYYEAYINFFIALLPLFLIFYKTQAPLWFSVVLVFIIIVLFIESFCTRNEYLNEHEKVMKYFKSKHVTNN